MDYTTDAEDHTQRSTMMKKNLYTSFYLDSKNNTILYTHFEGFFLKGKGFFDGVPRYEFSRLGQNGPETDQPASPVVEFTLTNHVHLSLTCGEAG